MATNPVNVRRLFVRVGIQNGEFEGVRTGGLRGRAYLLKTIRVDGFIQDASWGGISSL